MGWRGGCCGRGNRRILAASPKCGFDEERLMVESESPSLWRAPEPKAEQQQQMCSLGGRPQAAPYLFPPLFLALALTSILQSSNQLRKLHSFGHKQWTLSVLRTCTLALLTLVGGRLFGSLPPPTSLSHTTPSSVRARQRLSLCPAGCRFVVTHGGTNSPARAVSPQRSIGGCLRHRLGLEVVHHCCLRTPINPRPEISRCLRPTHARLPLSSSFLHLPSLGETSPLTQARPTRHATHDTTRHDHPR